MGHSAKYRIKAKSALINQAYREPGEQSSKKASDAWRKIEEYKILEEVRHNLEFFDDHLGGSLDDYLQ